MNAKEAPSKGAPSIAQVNPSGLSDVPTKDDGIGFTPYVRAIAWFLSDEETKPPLTVSVEGPWGSGKSSFMLQLEEQLAAVFFGIEKGKKVFGNPLAYDLAKSIRNLKYEDTVAFIDRFQDDFSDIVKSYAGEDARVFVFIDDLDRCEIPRAADLLQAINLLLSADQGNLFFILGLDREMVAAGIAAKNEKIFPYLAAGRVAQGSDKSDFYQIGIDYGYSFMEKFVQVPFRVPRPDNREITSWVSDLTGESDMVDAGSAGQIGRGTKASNKFGLDIRPGLDPEEFQDVVEDLARFFGFNPRRLKQFINVFRLRVLIALSTGVFVPVVDETGGPAAAAGLTLQQLGLFTAIMMRWSQLAGDLVQEPDLFNKLLDQKKPLEGVAAKWAASADLRAAINFDSAYSLAGVDLKPLLMIMPDVYGRVLGVRGLDLAKTRLFGPLAAQVPTNTPESFDAGFGSGFSSSASPAAAATETPFSPTRSTESVRTSTTGSTSSRPRPTRARVLK